MGASGGDALAGGDGSGDRSRLQVVRAAGFGLATLSVRADVAELVDAHGSGPCGGNPVEVQVLSSALALSAQVYPGDVKIGAQRGSRKRRTLMIVAAVLAEPVVMKLRGYRMGGNLVVRCRKGHLFTTIWVPGASLKAVRLGWWRFQRCPVGNHWSLVTPVKESDLTEDEKRLASEHKDVRIP